MNLINKKLINVNLKSTEKKEVLEEMVLMLENEGRVTDSKKFLKDVLKREAEVTTGFGDGLAIPHAQSEYVKEPTLLFGKSKEGVEYDSLDGKKVNILFMIAIPKDQKGDHLKLLQILSRKFMDSNFKEELEKVKTNEEALSLIESIFEEEVEQTKEEVKNAKMNIVAISNCPAGVAHTYMVAESLENKAKELGINIKVETQGASGVENKLTKEDIKNADYVVLALGKGLNEETKKRFNGKKVYNIKISEALKNIDNIFEDLENKSKVMTFEGTSEEEKEEKESIMTHLMAGVSAALPFVIGGGLLVALANILVQSGMPYQGLDTGNPTFAWVLENIGYIGFSMMIPIMGGYIAYSIADKPAFAPAFIVSWLANDKTLLQTEAGAGFLGAMVLGLAIGYFVKYFKKIKLPKPVQPLLTFTIIPFVTMAIFGILTYYVLGPIMGDAMNAMLAFLNNMPPQYMIPTAFLVGAMLAFDMGGPVNKTAWLFCFSLLDQQVYTWYGIVGVVTLLPPVAAGIATFIRPKLFSKSEREAGLSAIVVGATVATEPAIPYALSSPVAMISANVIAGGTTAVISMMLGIERLAPGLGIFDPLLGLMSPWYYYYPVLLFGIILNVTLIIVFRSIAMKRR